MAHIELRVTSYGGTDGWVVAPRATVVDELPRVGDTYTFPRGVGYKEFRLEIVSVDRCLVPTSDLGPLVVEKYIVHAKAAYEAMLYSLVETGHWKQVA